MSESSKTIRDLTEDAFRQMYYDDLLTEAQIAKRYGTYQVAINRWRRRRGFPTVGKTERITRKLAPLTKRQRELLIGSLLGDGSMRATSSNSARFLEGHSMKQRAYCTWKADILGNYVLNCYRKTKRDRNSGKIYYGWEFYTVSTTHLRPFYDLFYKEGKRVFPERLSEFMTPFSLAVWYMDDGHCRPGSNHPGITFGLDRLSLERALLALGGLGFEPSVRHNTDGTYTIRFLGQWERFRALVGPHIPECMAYKRLGDSLYQQRKRNARALSVGIASELHYTGRSLSDIAKEFGVSVSTVRRRLKGA